MKTRKPYYSQMKTLCLGLACLGISLFSVSPVLAEIEAEKISFTQNSLYPEGIDYDPGCDCFFVSSVGQGQIGQVFSNGKYRIFSDDSALISTIGLLVDSKNQRLYAAISDNGKSTRTVPSNRYKTAKLGIFDLKNGRTLKIVDLGILKPGAHFVNDLAQDKQGNVYITDSQSPVIYKVTPDGNASIFLEHGALAPLPKGFGMNGIVFHPRGFLLAAKSDSGEIFKIPLENPGALTRIQLDQPLGKNLDGLELNSKGQLAVMANRDATLFLLSSRDNWQTASLDDAAQFEKNFPTTCVSKGNKIFALYSNFNRKWAKEFAIEEAIFESQDGP